MTDAEVEAKLARLRDCLNEPPGNPARPDAYDTLLALLQAFPALTLANQALAARELAPQGRWLLSIAHHLAVVSVRSKGPELLRAGFTAIALEHDQNDYRDVLVTLALLAQSADKLGQPANELLREAIGRSGGWATARRSRRTASTTSGRGKRHLEGPVRATTSAGLDTRFTRPKNTSALP